jgi:hypothetical protein
VKEGASETACVEFNSYPNHHLFRSDEYIPQNIMFDKRVARGSTYASMVIPAGTSPDAMIMEKRNEEQKRRTRRQQNVRSFLNFSDYLERVAQ